MVQLIRLLNGLYRYIFILVAFLFVYRAYVLTKEEGIFNRIFRFNNHENLATDDGQIEDEYLTGDSKELFVYKPKGQWYLLILIVLFVAFAFGIFAMENIQWDTKPLIIGGIISSIFILQYVIIRVFFNKMDKLILILVNFLASIGFIMLYRLNTEFALSQLEWYAYGQAFFIATYLVFRVFKRIYKYYIIIFLFSIGLLITTLIFGTEIGGAKNWLILFGYSIQPAEIIKILNILVLASYMRNRKRIIELLPAFVFLGVLVIISLVQHDLGFALIYFMSGFVMLYVATSSFAYLLGGLSILSVGSIISYKLFYHLRTRIDTWINPWGDMAGRGFQITQSLFALSWGGLVGTGLGKGYPLLIPVALTDFIFSAICEEFGILMGSALIILYLIIIIRGIGIAFNCKHRFDMLVALGLIASFGFQTFVIIGGVIKLVPLTGITLPFISYGGSSIVSMFIMLGILQAIHVNNIEEITNEKEFKKE